MLAKLVVHIQGQHAHLVRSLQQAQMATRAFASGAQQTLGGAAQFAQASTRGMGDATQAAAGQLTAQSSAAAAAAAALYGMGDASQAAAGQLTSQNSAASSVAAATHGMSLAAEGATVALFNSLAPANTLLGVLQRLANSLVANSHDFQVMAAQTVVAGQALQQLGAAVVHLDPKLIQSVEQAETALAGLAITAKGTAVSMMRFAVSTDLALAGMQRISNSQFTAYMHHATQVAWQWNYALHRGGVSMHNSAYIWTLFVAKVAAVPLAFLSVLRVLSPVLGVMRHLLIVVQAASHVLMILAMIAGYVRDALGLLVSVLNGFRILLIVVLAPVYLFFKGLAMVARIAWAIAKPFFQLWLVIHRFKIQVAAARLAIAWLTKILGALSPRLKFLLFALTAVGFSAGRLAWAIGLVSAASNVVAGGFRLIYTGAMLVINPLKGMRLSLGLVKDGLKLAAHAVMHLYWKQILLIQSIVWATRELIKFSAAQAWKAAAASADYLNRKVGGIATGLAKGLAALTAGGLLFGVKIAAATEQASIGFTNMLKDARLAGGVMKMLEDFSAGTPFKLPDIREGAKQLLNASVPVNQLKDRLTMLGDVAAGTGKPILDFVKIFAKVKQAGKATLEEIKQLSERNVPIYTELQKQLGVSRTEMMKMISAGKVGFSDVDAVLKTLTTSTGVFAGASAAQSRTLSGLWSTFVDNLSLMLGDFAQLFIDAFDFKGALANSTSFVQRMRAGMSSIAPVVIAVAQALKAQWSMMGQIWSAITGAISSRTGETFGSIVELIITAMAMAEYSFLNWGTVAEYAFGKIQIGVIGLARDLGHFFGTVLPTYLNHFKQNWWNTFYTAFNLVTTIFINLGTNIRRIMRQIWDFIKSGGTSSFKVAWTPLTDGFVSSLKELPNIPPRVLTPLEQQLRKSSNALGEAIGSGMQKHVDKRMAGLTAFRKQMDDAANLEDVDLTLEGDGRTDEDAAGGAQEKDKTFKAATGAEAYSAVVAAMMQPRDNPVVAIAQKQLVAQEKQVEATQEVAGAIGGIGKPRLIEGF